VILRIRVSPKASRNLIKEEEGYLKVYLTKPAQDSQANNQLIELLAQHLKVKKYRIKIIQGLKSRDKVVEIES